MLFILYETFVWKTFVLLGLIVYIHTCCVPIATLNQNKQSRLLYLGNMHIIIKVLACGLVFSHLIGFFSCNRITFQKYFLKVYGSVHVNSKRAHPPLRIYPQAFVGHLSSCWSRRGESSRNICAQGWGICQIL